MPDLDRYRFIVQNPAAPGSGRIPRSYHPLGTTAQARIVCSSAMIQAVPSMFPWPRESTTCTSLTMLGRHSLWCMHSSHQILGMVLHVSCPLVRDTMLPQNPWTFHSRWVQVQRFAGVQQLMITDVLCNASLQSTGGLLCRHARDDIPAAEHAPLEVFTSRRVTGAQTASDASMDAYELCRNLSSRIG